eukprot:1332583-Pleurochrysis_carterae.AAC.1
MSIIRWQHLICKVDSHVRRMPLPQNCTIAADKAWSFPATDGAGENSLKTSLINFERVGDVPFWLARSSRGSPAARRGARPPLFAGLVHSSLDHG